MERDGIIILDPGLEEKIMLACICCKTSLMPDKPAPEPEDKAEFHRVIKHHHEASIQCH